MSLIKRCPDCEKPVEASAGACTHCGADLKGAVRGNIWLKLQERLARAADRYEIQRLIGYGGMAGVYLAWDKKLSRSVALKLIQPSVAMDPRMVRRFFQEAQTMAQLGHRHIVQIYDMDERDDMVWMSMQYVPGRTLGEVLSDSGEPLPADLVCTWLADIASALAHAHERDTPVIHRDVKPSNILLNENGEALLTDFGIAKLQGESGLTQTSHLIGTPAYMSPEQCQGGSLGPASDQYSLGTVAFELLAGVPPFKGPTLVVLQSHREVAAPDILEFRPELPEEMANVVRRMLAKSPGDRWPSMAEASEQFRKSIRKRVPPKILAAWSKRVHQISIPECPDHLTLGTSEKLIAQALDHEGRELDGRRVRWSSTDERVAFVSPNGVVAGLGVGSAVIVAETGRVVTTIELHVREPVVHHVTVSPPSLEMPSGETRQLTVTCYSRAGDVVSASPSFEVDHPDLVEVTPEGLITGVGTGETVVTVRAGGRQEQVAVRVVAAPVASLMLPTSWLTLELGQTSRLPVEARSADGRVQPDAALWWTSSDPSIVAVSGTGVLRATGLGQAQVTASAGTASATLSVQVIADQATVDTEPIDEERAGLKGVAVPPAPPTPDATVVFQEPSEDETHRTMPPPQQPPVHAGAPPMGATVMFQGPGAAVAPGTQGAPDAGYPPAGTPEDAGSPTPTPRPIQVRRRKGASLALGRREAMAVGGGIGGLILLFGLYSLWNRTPPTPSAPVAVVAAPNDTTLAVGDEFTYRLDADGSQVPTGVWRSSDASVVFVSQAGVVRAVGEGSAVISLEGSGLADGGVQAVVNVLSEQPPGSLAILGPDEVRLGSDPLTYRLQAPDGTPLDEPGIAWIVEPGNLASVTPDGRLTGRGAGTVRLSAALDGQSASLLVRILDEQRPTPGPGPIARPSGIRIAGAPTGPVEVGSTVSLDAWLVDQNGQRLPGGALTWTSGNPGALRQTGASSFQATAAGEVTVRVASGTADLSQSVRVAIVPRVDVNVPTQVAVVPRQANLTIGQSTQFSATARNREGSTIPDATIQWAANDASIATVSVTGTVQGVSTGTTYIVAGSGGVLDSVLVSVTGVAEATGEDGRREAARYFALFRDRDVGSLTSLIPANERDRHRSFLDLVGREWFDPQGAPTGQRVDGDQLTFTIQARQRTNFGSWQDRRLDFLCRLTQGGGTWSASTCVLAPGSYVPGE